MNGVYKSLKVRVQDTLQRGKTNSTPLPRVKSGNALSLSDEMEELERIVADRIGRLKSAFKEGEATVVDEAQQARQLVESLKASNAVLEAKLTETKEAVQRNDSSRQQSEESLTAKVQDLQNEVKKKEESLASLDKQINDLKSSIDVQLKQKGDLESAIEKAKQEAASHAKRAEQLAEISRIKVSALESQLREKEELGRQNESTIKGLEQKLTAKVQDFESLVRDKEEQLAGRDAEINRSQVMVETADEGHRSDVFLFQAGRSFSWHRWARCQRSCPKRARGRKARKTGHSPIQRSGSHAHRTRCRARDRVAGYIWAHNRRVCRSYGSYEPPLVVNCPPARGGSRRIHGKISQDTACRTS